jgi:hypothetical protein
VAAAVVAGAIALVPGVAAAGGDGARQHPIAIVLRQLPAVVRAGDVMTVRGSVRNAARGTVATLQVAPLGLRPGDRWRVVARARLTPGGAFALRWRVAGRGFEGIAIRVTAIRRGRTLASTATLMVLVAPAPVYCAAPVAPAVNIPVGDGWVVGGLYIEGGPAPGVYECNPVSYTVTATNAAGAAVASERVAGGHSYTLVLPAGAYALRAMPCGFGTATITAGEQTKADMVCPVP